VVIFITLWLIEVIIEIEDEENKKIDEENKKIDEYNSKVDKYNQALENGENPEDDF
jgi:hypothetical protein